MNEQFSIIYVLNKSFKKNHYVPPHSHTCHELIFYCESPVEIKYNTIHRKAKDLFDFNASFKERAKINVNKNSFVIIPPNVAHDEYHFGDNTVMCIGFSCSGKENLSPFIYKEISDNKIGIRLILEQICDEFMNKKYGFERYMNNLFNNLMLTLFRNTKQEIDNNDELKYIEQYIKQNIGRNITISSLADMSGYSESHFRRVFREKIGISPKRYIAKLRMESANRLIKEGSFTLSEIAELTGFTDYFQFATFYKKECGISPGKYRKSN